MFPLRREVIGVKRQARLTAGVVVKRLHSYSDPPLPSESISGCKIITIFHVVSGF